DPWCGASDHDFAFLRFDLHAFAVAQPDGVDDLSRQPHREVVAPSADRSLNHRKASADIQRISAERVKSKRGGYLPSVGLQPDEHRVNVGSCPRPDAEHAAKATPPPPSA